MEVNMSEVKNKHTYFNTNDVFNYVACGRCPYFRSHTATRFDPPEQECLDGDFGNDHPCDEMLGAVERLIDDGSLSNSGGYLAPHSYCADNELFEPEEGWSAHEYWWVFYSDEEPLGFDSTEEIFKECFI
jgi:hypothetical protein